MTRIGVACGAVPWERELLSAMAQRPDVSIARRHVDMTTLLRDQATADAPDVLLVSPALRGFDEKAFQRLMGSPTRVVVLTDTVRPPWLDALDVEQHDHATFDFTASLDRWLSEAPAEVVAENPGWDRLVLFAGTGGGVGTTTLACACVGRNASLAFVEADLSAPSAELLLGPGAEHHSMLPLHRGVDSSHLPGAIQSALRDASRVVVDAGRLDLDADLPWDSASLVLVTPATPLGIIRVCASVEHLGHRTGPLAILVNRVRASATGSAHGGAAMRAIVERATGVDPILIPDRTDDCDSAWLEQDMDRISDLMPPLEQLRWLRPRS